MFTVLYALGWLFLILISMLGHPRIFAKVFKKPKASDDFNGKA